MQANFQEQDLPLKEININKFQMTEDDVKDLSQPFDNEKSKNSSNGEPLSSVSIGTDSKLEERISSDASWYQPGSSIEKQQSTVSTTSMNENQEIMTKLVEKLSSLEQQLFQKLFEEVSIEEMASINKFILVPIGLPGMGKTTLSRFLNNVTTRGVLKVNHTNQILQKLQPEEQQQTTNLRLDFQKISYDRILTGNAQIYCEANQGVDLNEAIDITRGKTDQDYLNQVASLITAPPDEENVQQGVQSKSLIYLDRNNTPDVWAHISKTIEEANKDKPKDFKTILITPEQHRDFIPESYTTQNPISPQMMFECIKRIFGRKAHDCLSAANKPKVAEVILKFARLYDGCQLDDDQTLLKHFDDFVRLDFLQFNQRSNLLDETIGTITDCFNQTPPNFQVPSDEVIAKCIAACDKQILIDEQSLIMEANGPKQMLL